MAAYKCLALTLCPKLLVLGMALFKILMLSFPKKVLVVLAEFEATNLKSKYFKSTLMTLIKKALSLLVRAANFIGYLLSSPTLQVYNLFYKTLAT